VPPDAKKPVFISYARATAADHANTLAASLQEYYGELKRVLGNINY
jgi:hypothetical protein